MEETGRHKWLAEAGRIFAILLFCIMFYAIISKGVSDISDIARNNPDDFWRSLAWYFIRNIGGLNGGQ